MDGRPVNSLTPTIGIVAVNVDGRGIWIQKPLQQVLQDALADDKVDQWGGGGRPGGFGPTDDQADQGLTPATTDGVGVAVAFGLVTEQALHLITQRGADSSR